MENIKKVLGFIIGLTESFAVSLEDGKFDYVDIMNFWEPVKTLPDLMEALETVVSDVAKLSPEQITGLVDWVKAEFDIPQDNIEASVENLLDAGIKIMSAIVMFQKARQS